ncbi:MAG: hypothetical protein AABY07_09925 [Nanoarchaeota archaeon]
MYAIEQGPRREDEQLTSYLFRILNNGNDMPKDIWLNGFNLGNFSCHMVGFDLPDHVLSLYRVLTLKNDLPEPETITLHKKGTDHKDGLWVRFNFHGVGDNWYHSRTIFEGRLADYCVENRKHFQYNDGERLCKAIADFISNAPRKLVSGNDLRRLLGWDE